MNKKKDLVVGLIVGLFGIYYIQQVYHLPAGEHFLNSTRTFPLLFGGLLVILSVLLITGALQKKDDEKKTSNIDLVKVKRGLFYVVWTALYIFVGLPLLGFILSTIIFLAVGIFYYREVTWYWAPIISVATVVVIYFVFSKWMLIHLP